MRRRSPLPRNLGDRSRLMIVAAGIPEPVVQWEIRSDGRFIARVDLAYPELKIAIEYEGDGHRTERAQWRIDIRRQRDLEDEGWIVIRLTSSTCRMAARPSSVAFGAPSLPARDPRKKTIVGSETWRPAPVFFHARMPRNAGRPHERRMPRTAAVRGILCESGTSVRRERPPRRDGPRREPGRGRP